MDRIGSLLTNTTLNATRSLRLDTRFQIKILYPILSLEVYGKIATTTTTWICAVQARKKREVGSCKSSLVRTGWLLDFNLIIWPQKWLIGEGKFGSWSSISLSLSHLATTTFFLVLVVLLSLHLSVCLLYARHVMALCVWVPLIGWLTHLGARRESDSSQRNLLSFIFRAPEGRLLLRPTGGAQFGGAKLCFVEHVSGVVHFWARALSLLSTKKRWT